MGDRCSSRRRSAGSGGDDTVDPRRAWVGADRHPDRRPRPADEGLGALGARRPRHRPVLDAALPPHAQQRDGVQPRRRTRAGDRRRRPGRRRRAAACRCGGRRARPATVAVGLVIGGAAGNVVDRLFRSPGWLRGAVVDFIDFQWWPIFNVADMAITIGGVAAWSSAAVVASVAQPAARRVIAEREDGVISEIVPSALAGERLDRIVSFVADVSRSHAAATIAAGGVRVDGVPAASGKVRLVEGQQVEVDESTIPRCRCPVADPSVEFGVVYEDAAVIVVDKPAGARRAPRRRQHGGHARATGCSRGIPTSPASATRRGRASSTVSTPAAPGCSSWPARRTSADRLVAQFASRVATVGDASLRGARVGPPGGRRTASIDAPIGRDRRDPLRMAVVADGRPARTEYWLVERFDGAGRAGPARLPARDRPDPPDPRPPRARSVIRSSATRPTASGARRSASSVRSCTPPSWRSTTRRRASGSSSAASSPPTSPTCSRPHADRLTPDCLRQTPARLSRQNG